MTELSANGTFDAEWALGYLTRHAVPGVDRVHLERRTLTRLLPTRAGPVATAIHMHRAGVTVTLADSARDPPAELHRLVAGWLDLESDLDVVGSVLDADPVLAAIGRLRPGLRLIGYPDPFEATIVTVLGQQVSVRAAATFAGRLAAAFGRTGACGLTIFPDPERLAGVPVGDLQATVGVTAARARTLPAVAELFAGGFRLEPGASDRRTALLDVPGIGQWTVDYLAMRALHDRDACPASDLVLRRALALDKPSDVLRRAERWRPFRAYAVMRMWTAAVTRLPIQ